MMNTCGDFFRYFVPKHYVLSQGVRDHAKNVLNTQPKKSCLKQESHFEAGHASREAGRVSGAITISESLPHYRRAKGRCFQSAPLPLYHRSFSPDMVADRLRNAARQQAKASQDGAHVAAEVAEAWGSGNTDPEALFPEPASEPLSMAGLFDPIDDETAPPLAQQFLDRNTLKEEIQIMKNNPRRNIFGKRKSNPRLAQKERELDDLDHAIRQKLCKHLDENAWLPPLTYHESWKPQQRPGLVS